MNLFSFFYPDVQMSAKQEKNQKKKTCPNSLSVLQNFAVLPFFFFPASEKFTPHKRVEIYGIWFCWAAKYIMLGLSLFF